ncbi:restriction endonuclease subunit S [Alcanivorax sp.]|uniref:restriction endonuclease subunit S n=1 Tax=Alcanivorax sp. TaxID=1872427 RepID=UPI000C10E65A|nr:restriction endonuclease subunit S [Alcanivorax sp.]PHR63738.1 MAG: hypothetical protein COA55_15900 [Alcanivorax sp.]
MMEHWQSMILRDLLRVEHGFAFKGEYFADSGHYVVLTPGNFYEEGGFKLRPGKDRFYLGEIPERYILSKGSMIVAMTEQAEGLLGSPAIMPESDRYLHNQRLGLVRPIERWADLRFLYYLFNTNVVREQIRNSSSGAKVRHTSPERIYGTKVLVPGIAIQRKIAAILTAYDDLIEVNKRRIALLEKMAEELYREWFVRLRFPGYQKTRFVKGVPEGWPFDVGRAFFDHVKGKSYASHEISDEDGTCFFITLKSFHRRGGYRKEGLKYFSGSYKDGQSVEAGDVVMAVTDMTQDRAVVGEVARIPKLHGKKSVISLDVIRLMPKNMSTTFLYSYMRYSGFANYIKEYANGANVLHLKPDLIGKQRLLFPPAELRDQFSSLVEPFYQEIDALEEANGVLTKTRDLLLPRLISGKLSVEDLDIQFPPSMQETTAEQESLLEARRA